MAKVKVNKDEYKILYESDESIVLEPLTHNAAVKYGFGTRWCVAMRDRPFYFNVYTNKGDYYNGKRWKRNSISVNDYPDLLLFFVIFKKSTSLNSKVAFVYRLSNSEWYDNDITNNIDIFNTLDKKIKIIDLYNEYGDEFNNCFHSMEEEYSNIKSKLYDRTGEWGDEKRKELHFFNRNRLKESKFYNYLDFILSLNNF